MTKELPPSSAPPVGPRFEAYADELIRWSRATNLPVATLRRTDSTNLLARVVARRVAAEPGPERALFAAWEQTAGRGRLGRSWSSTAGLGVYATLALFEAAALPLELLPLVAGVGLCRGLRHFLPEAGLKWPNDLVVGGRKVGGILIETLPGRCGAAALVGFGINYGHAPSQLPTSSATSLRCEGAAGAGGGPTLGRLTATLASALLEAIDRLVEPPDILDAYRGLTVHRPGDPLRCRIQARSIEGRFLDFDGSGRLLVWSGDETVVVAAGDVLEGERETGIVTERSREGRA